MRIEAIETILAHNWSFVRVHTDSGISGIGEGTFWGYPAATHSVIEVLKKYLIGQDPLRIEHHWQNLYRAHCFRGAAVSSALAAIDIALWDIAGKHYGAPVYQLLGGMVRDKVRLYAMTGGGSVEEIVEKANAYVDEGYSAIKINPIPLDHHLMGHSELIKETVARVAAVRDAVGSHVDIGVEMHRKLGPGEAIAIGAELERFHLMFYEDPIPPENIQSWREVAAQVRIPIATGERLYNIFEFRELLEARGVHIVRPDVGVAGGLSQCKKIAAVAESYNAYFMPHNAFSPVATIAHVQLDAAVPNFLIQEYGDDHKSPKREVLKTPLEPKDGYLSVPDGPGLGIELNDEFISSHPFSIMEATSPIREDGSAAYA